MNIDAKILNMILEIQFQQYARKLYTMTKWDLFYMQSWLNI